MQQLEELIRQINEAQQQQAESGLSTETFTLGWLLKQAGLTENHRSRIAAAMEATLQTYPHWRTFGEQARKVRQALYAQLENVGVKNLPDLVEQIMSVLRRYQKR